MGGVLGMEGAAEVSTLTKVWRERALDAESNLETLEANHAQLLKERDELRAQVATLKYGIERAYGSNHNRVYAVLHDLRKEHTTIVGAQYIRGLEAALQSFIEAYYKGIDLDNETMMRPMIKQAEQSLATKEGQG